MVSGNSDSLRGRWPTLDTTMVVRDVEWSPEPSWSLDPGTYSWAVEATDGYASVMSPSQSFFFNAVPTDTGSPPEVPRRLVLHANVPNPFGESTRLSYEVPEATRVHLSVYDLLGRQVAVLVDQAQAAGRHQAVWQPTGLASGVYLARLQAGRAVTTRQLLLIQ